MGTRADFYVASGDDRLDLSLEYLGTISADGSEVGDVAAADTERKFRGRVAKLLRERGGARFPKINSLVTDNVLVWVPGVGIVRREGDPQDKRDLVARYALPDTGAGVYVSVAAENEWHARAQATRDPETGDYTIPEWDAHWGFRDVTRVEGVGYRYPDTREAIGVVERFGGRDA